MRYRLSLEDGQPRLLAGDQRLAPLIYSTGHPDSDQFALFGGLGVNVASFPATCDFHLYGLAPDCWLGPREYDYKGLEDTIEVVLAGNPDALLMPRVFTCTPPWWDRKHPGDLVAWEDGTSERPLLHGARKHAVPSLASARWQEQRATNLRNLVRHVESSPHADRVVGYLVTSGTSEEWFHWGTQEGYLFDYSGVARSAFRRWLHARYGTEEALSSAWGRRLSLAGADIPPPSRRRRHTSLGFFDSIRDADVVDHARFLADLTADAIRSLAAVVKEETGRAKLFGTFYGYLLELAHHKDGIRFGGHASLRSVLADPNVDFLASPTSYERRVAGGGFSMSMVPWASVERAGKVFFHENDVRTHVLVDDAGYGRTENRFQTAAIQRREFASALTQGQGMWWFDMTAGWYDDPATCEAIAVIKGICDRALELPRRSVTQIALVLDPNSLLHCEAPQNQVVQLLTTQCLELSRAGAPFDVILLDDLDESSPYRLLLFPTLFIADETRIKDLHARLESLSSTALFIVAPGLGDPDPGCTTALTGMELCAAAAGQHLVVETPGGASYGTWSWWQRLLQVTDPAAETLGTYAGSREVALARKVHAGWTSVFSAAPAVCGPVLNSLAREAGVHLYTENDDAIHACSRFVAVHARSSGCRTLHVPGSERLYDLVNEVELTGADDRFPVYLPLGETALFFRGSQARWSGR